MSNSQLEISLNTFLKETKIILTDIRGLVLSIVAAVRLRSKEPLIEWFKEGSVVDPVRFKRILVRLLKILIVIELVSAFVEGLSTQVWTRFGTDLVIAGILYVAWEKIATTVRETKEEYKKKMETAPHAINLWNALIFSLLWSDKP